MLSMSALAHILDNVQAKTAGTSPSIGSAKRGPLGLHRARSARIQIRYSISCEFNPFPPLQLRGGRPTRQSRRSSGDFSVPSTGPMQSLSPMLPPQSPPYWQRAFSRAPLRRRRWLSLLSSDGKRGRRARYTHRVPAQERGTAGALSLLILLTLI